MKKLFLIMTTIGLLAYWFFPSVPKTRPIVVSADPLGYSWEIQAIDTMKYSRDVASEKLNDASFDTEIARQVQAIANTGATHVAIATPYDEKFYPFLKRWVDAARKEHLHVWFRGNWSGWEGWFGFAKTMTRAEHIQKTKEFILKHPDIFVDGDLFSGCPECENGGSGDPRHTGDVVGYRKFLIDEYGATKDAFISIHKKVASNYFSMNGDVARLVMDRPTTRALDGIVTIDHYVATPEQLAKDIRAIAQSSGGQVFLGEWGVPIPDIHGSMTESERVRWMDQALRAMIDLGRDVKGMSYWSAVGGSTELWLRGSELSAMSETLRKYYEPQVVYGRVTDELGQPIVSAEVFFTKDKVMTDSQGRFEIRSFDSVKEFSITSPGYISVKRAITRTFQKEDVVLVKSSKDTSFKFLLWLKQSGWIR